MKPRSGGSTFLSGKIYLVVSPGKWEQTSIESYDFHFSLLFRTVTMPRPKIRPENRVRAYRACDACKTSKTRCDAKSPCANCIKKNRSNRCTYHAASTGRAGRRRLKSRSLLSPVADTNHQEEFPHGVPEPEDLISIPYTATGVLPSVSGGSSLSGNTPLSMPTADDIPVGQIPVGEESPQEHFVTGSNGEKCEHSPAYND